MRGARGALEPLFRLKVPDFRMAWTFIDMVPADSLTTAKESAARINDFRLATFHDAKHLLGRAMARRLGWKAHVAWDTYFVYKPGTLWTETEMPAPDEWFHQLKDREVWEQAAEAELGTADWTHALAKQSEADPDRFRTGRDLLDALTKALNETSGVLPAATADTILGTPQ